MHINITALTAGQGARLVAFFATGEVSDADLASFPLNSWKPESASDLAGQSEIRMIWWETLRHLIPAGNGTEAYCSITATLGGGKGIPIYENRGIKLVIMNISNSAMTTGSVASCLGCLYAVELG